MIEREKWGWSFLPAVAAAFLAICFIGCGGSESKEGDTNRWVTELLLVNGDFAQTSHQAKKEIASAQTAAKLGAAYSSYAESLRAQAEKLEGIDAPVICSAAQEHIVRFVNELASISEELSHQDTLQRSRFEQLQQQQLQATRGLLTSFRPIVTSHEC